MAYTYLTLTNDVCKRLNEIELTSSNFSSATGQHAQIKDSINYALRDLNQDAYEWPFNWTEKEQTLTAGTMRYAFPSGFKTSSMDTFRIKRDGTIGNETRALSPKSYEEYLTSYLDDEYNTSDTGIRAIPEFVFRTPDLKYCVAPSPDEAYTLVYEYYSIPDDLSAYSDVPTAPEQFRKTIVDGAMYYCYMFRGDVENTQMTQAKFSNDIKQMRSLYINRHDYAKSTMIVRESYPVNERVS